MHSSPLLPSNKHSLKRTLLLTRNAFVFPSSPYRALTHDVEKGEELAEEVSVGPEVVVLQVGVEVVDEQLLLLPLLHLGDDPQVEVHHEGGDLARLPVFPQPPRDVKENRLKKRDREIEI